jgi:3-hydroxyacyl-CoA dehydrogenase
LETRTLRSVGIVGAGLMGRSIALVHLERGVPVVLTDVSREALDRAETTLQQEAADRLALLTVRSSLADLAGCELVVETVVENLKAKRQVFARLEPVVSRDALLASNTSCLTIGQIAAGLATAERVCGLHFCHPVRGRPVVEVVRAAATMDSAIATACDHVRSLAMDPVLVKDRPGFVVNRVLHPYLNEALALLKEGAGIQEVDAAAVAFGMPWGPLTQIDEIGIDVVLRGGQAMAQTYPAHAGTAELLVALFGMGRLGCKTGAGIYSYAAADAPIVDAAMQELLDQRRKPRSFPAEDIARRLFSRMAEECRRIVQEQIVASFSVVARALVKGLGFPAAKVRALRS